MIFELFKDYSNLLVPLENNHYNAYHIYVIKLVLENLNVDRDTIFKELKNNGIGVNVHYMPIHLHPYYQSLGYKKGICPSSENIYARIITLPIFPLLSDEEVKIVADKVIIILNKYKI